MAEGDVHVTKKVNESRPTVHNGQHAELILVEAGTVPQIDLVQNLQHSFAMRLGILTLSMMGIVSWGSSFVALVYVLAVTTRSARRTPTRHPD